MAFERARLHNWSNAHCQYRNGTLEDEQWLPHLREIQHNSDNAILKRVWAQWSYAFADQFRKLMDDSLSKGGSQVQRCAQAAAGAANGQ
ncbi:MAG: hypothetical protein RL261_2268 [Pseudomonadota bacterium]